MASLPHTKSGSREYRTWSAMKSRCYNPSVRSYEHYGGRGIYVCDRWKHNYDAFLEDMGKCPEGYTLDRIDNDGPYSPDNCRWADRTTQNRNKPNLTQVPWKGRCLTTSEVAEVENVDGKLLGAHLRRGVPPVLAVWRCRALRAKRTGEVFTSRVCAWCLKELPLSRFPYQERGLLGTYPACDDCKGQYRRSRSTEAGK